MPGEVIRCALSDLLLADLSVSVVFCYDGPLDETRLAAGLEQALVRVPAFAGRLREGAGGLEIVCDGTGSSFRAADSALTLAEAVGRLSLPESGLVDHVDAAAARTGAAPVLTARLNRLADGTSVLGVSWHHAIGDMGSFTTFMRTWSATTAGEAIGSPPAVTDREAFLDEALPEKDSGRPGFRVVAPEEAARLSEVAASCRLANRLLQIHFGESELERMRAHLAEEAGTRLSRGDALAAHVVAAIRSLDGDTAARDLTMPVDLRRILDVPRDVIGNLLGEIHLRCREGSTAAGTAAGLRAAVRDFTEEHLSLRTSRTLLAELGPNGLDRCVPLGFDPDNRTFTFSSWRGFGAYDVAFDGRRPVLFSPAISLPLPWVCWAAEGVGGRGALCTVALPAALAAKLRTPAGRALLHAHRAPNDEPPPLLAAVRRMV